MYIPHKYKNENLAEVKDFLNQNAFGILVNEVDGKPYATHTPMELDIDIKGNDVLLGHIAKANLQWTSFEEQKEVLCIFNGPHTYISSSWYKEEEVPTWNYIAVHVYGKLRILEKEELLNHLDKLVNKYEQSSKNPVSVQAFSKKTMSQIKGVVGFEITITNIQAAYKLSQGREHDHSKIIRELEDRGNDAQAIAKAMRNRNSLSVKEK